MFIWHGFSVDSTSGSLSGARWRASTSCQCHAWASLGAVLGPSRRRPVFVLVVVAPSLYLVSRCHTCALPATLHLAYPGPVSPGHLSGLLQGRGAGGSEPCRHRDSSPGGIMWEAYQTLWCYTPRQACDVCASCQQYRDSPTACSHCLNEHSGACVIVL